MREKLNIFFLGFMVGFIIGVSVFTVIYQQSMEVLEPEEVEAAPREFIGFPIESVDGMYEANMKAARCGKLIKKLEGTRVYVYNLNGYAQEVILADKSNYLELEVGDHICFTPTGMLLK